jgi:hypothetical protein
MNKHLVSVGAAALFALLILSLSACGGSVGSEDSRESAELKIDVLELADALIDGVAFDDQMELASDDAFYALYVIDPSGGEVSDFALYASTGATAEEVAVIEVTNAESAAAVLTSAQARIAAQKLEFENYAPTEMPKLSDPVLVSLGKYIILCVSNDNEASQKIIETFIEP